MLKQKLREDGIYLIKATILYLVLVGLVFVVSGPVGELLEEREILMAAKDEAVPFAILELIGMQKLGQFPADVEVFFLGLMILNVGMIVGIFVHSVAALHTSFKKSRFSFLIMQIMPLWKNYIFVLADILFKTVLSWWIYMLVLRSYFGILIADLHMEDQIWLQKLLGEVGIRGMVLVLFVTACGMLLGMNQRWRVYGVDIGIMAAGVSIVLGNLYKLPQYIAYMQGQGVGNAEKTKELAEILKNMRMLCPLSWLNPVNIYNATLRMSQLWIYVILSVVFFVLIGLWYCRRDWEEL